MATSKPIEIRRLHRLTAIGLKHQKKGSYEERESLIIITSFFNALLLPMAYSWV